MMTIVDRIRQKYKKRVQIKKQGRRNDKEAAEKKPIFAYCCAIAPIPVETLCL
jgi:hypothetical protein